MRPASFVLILDFGSQYTQLIARRIRELRVYCEIRPCSISAAEVAALDPSALILSGGPASVFAEDAPVADPALLDLQLPTLGICYGMQWLCAKLDGEIERAAHHEYGPAELQVTDARGILSRLSRDERTGVWMSHGDRVIQLPAGFSIFAQTSSTPHAVVGDEARKIYGLQSHPEVVQTKKGKEVIASLLFDVANLEATWTPASFIENTVEAIRKQAGQSRAVCGLSGGVDSSVAAALVGRALGERLTCIFVDNGLLREGEVHEVRNLYAQLPDIRLKIVDASEKFLNALSGVTDPETKRKIIGKIFIEVFDAASHDEDNVEFLVQGTLYPDVIESVSQKGPSAVIKSHHNVGGLPENMRLKLIEPLRELFKDEVREIGRAMGLPAKNLGRHPFPGPGLAIRCLGEITAEKLAILRAADRIWDEEMRRADVYDSIWQAFCVILPVRTVGVMGDNRTYDYVIAIRAVESHDGMTADWARLPYDLLARASSRIINEVRGCNRVVYDISTKPPSTIEWE